jgi:hypothetical protein
MTSLAIALTAASATNEPDNASVSATHGAEQESHSTGVRYSGCTLPNQRGRSPFSASAKIVREPFSS